MELLAMIRVNKDTLDSLTMIRTIHVVTLILICISEYKSTLMVLLVSSAEKIIVY